VSAALPQALLSIQKLSVEFKKDGRLSRAVNDLSFDVRRGESIGIVGESGSGKSVTALSVLRLLKPQTSVTKGRILLEGRDILLIPESEMSRIRGRRIAMVFQEPMSALDPAFTIGSQINETIRAHFKATRTEAREKAIEMLDLVGISSPRLRYDNYPYQLSGGMRQRVMIAIALACEPDILIADEPTTALDATIQAQIIDLMVSLTSRTDTALILITHDLAVVSQACGRIITMYGGALVEDGPARDVLRRPLHPYTSGLLGAMPGSAPPKTLLRSIPGRLASNRSGVGCNFRERCTHSQPRCMEEQSISSDGVHAALCCRAKELTLPGAEAT
jgi:peptide/nickel transport system ATP-binding protein